MLLVLTNRDRDMLDTGGREVGEKGGRKLHIISDAGQSWLTLETC